MRPHLISKQQEAAAIALALTAVSIQPVAVYFRGAHSFCAVDKAQSYVAFADTQEALIKALVEGGWSPKPLS